MAKLKIALGAAALVFASAGAQAQDATFEASATILEALAITKNVDLAFARIVPDAGTAGTVVVSTGGVRTCAPVLTCSGTVAAADFTVVGADGASYSVTLPSAANISSGGNNMLVQDFTTSLVGGNGTLTGGTSNFQVGGTLNVAAAQPSGAYTGTFTVTVNYN